MTAMPTRRQATAPVERQLPRRATLLVRISDARDFLDANGHTVTDTEGVDLQIKRGVTFAERLGWMIDKVRVENDVSAFKRKKIMRPNGRYELRTVRPEFQATLDDLASGVQDGLLVSDIDRAMRDPRDFEDLVDVVEQSFPRIPVEAVSGSLKLANDGDVKSSRILVTMANGQSKDTSRRVADRRLAQAEQGKFGGGRRPYGFGVPTGALDVRNRPALDVTRQVPAEAAEIARGFEQTLAGVSMRQQVADLRKRGVPTVTGAEWTAATWRDMLLRPRNAGLAVYKGEIMPGVVLAGVDDEHPPIVSRETWEAVYAKLTSPHRVTNPGPAARWLGSGIYLCGHAECVGLEDRPVMRVGSAGASGNGATRRPAYGCTRKAHLLRAAERLDKHVAAVLIGRMTRPDAVRLVAPEVRVDTAALSTEANAIRQTIIDAGDLFQARVWNKVEYITRRKELEAELDAITAKLNASVNVDPLAELAGKPNAGAIWKGMSLGRQRAILKHAVRVTIGTANPAARPPGWKPGQPYFDAESIRVEWLTEPATR